MNSTQAFYRLAYNREGADCSVRALAVACAVPYVVAHAAMHFAGRGPEQTASVRMVSEAARSLGFVLVPVQVQSKTMRTLTREIADEPGAFLAVTCDHVVGIWQGEIIDWSRDRLSRVKHVFIVARQESCHVT